MSSRTWMVLSYFANVDGMAPSVHLDSRVRELRRRGNRVLLVTSLASHPGKEDTWRVPSILPSGIRYEMRRIFLRRPGTLPWKALKGGITILLLPFYALEKAVLPFDANWSWYLSARRTAIRLAKRYRPDVIYSTGGPVTAHLAAGMATGKTGVPWIAEFQDPLRTGSSERNVREASLHRRIEKLVAQKAGGVIYLTVRLKEKATSRFNFSGRVETIYPGSQPQESTILSGPFESTDRVSFVHIGTLSSTRNLKGILAAMEILRQKHSGIYGNFRLVQYGHADKQVVSDARKYPDHVQLMGRTSHGEALEIMARSDVLLLVQDLSDISEETIPSKVYEYLQSGRPILGLVYRNPELKNILEEHGHTCVQVDDPSAIACALVDLMVRRSEGNLEDGIKSSEMTVTRAVDRLEELVESITGTAAHGS